MAVEIVWLDQAKDDLREILGFIAKDNAWQQRVMGTA